MHLPARHNATLYESLDLPKMPNGVDWNGDIAFLDRDGVLNVGSSEYIKSVDEVVMLPNAADCVSRLRQAGFRICIVTNQSPIGRGIISEQTLAEINDKIMAELSSANEQAILDLILYSPYVPWANAWSRKGNPGMLQIGRQIIDAANSGIELQNFDYGPDYTARTEGRSFMVGDRQADLKAGLAYGIRTFLCDPDIGISSVIDRLLDDDDLGDGR